MRKHFLIIAAGTLTCLAGFTQALDFTAIKAEVDFSRTMQVWDGFGFNYVETAHSSDMDKFKQEYGGFSLLDESEKQEIISMAFGEEGREPASLCPRRRAGIVLHTIAPPM